MVGDGYIYLTFLGRYCCYNLVFFCLGSFYVRVRACAYDLFTQICEVRLAVPLTPDLLCWASFIFHADEIYIYILLVSLWVDKTNEKNVRIY